jgi:DNA-binding MarR family transcriptional regulator
MVAAKLVVARPDRADARQQNYSLASEGRRKLARALPLWQAIHDQTEGLVKCGEDRMLQLLDQNGSFISRLQKSAQKPRYPGDPLRKKEGRNLLAAVASYKAVERSS